jgi:hypothetical protein
VGYDFDEDYELFLDTLVANVSEDADLIEFEGTKKKQKRLLIIPIIPVIVITRMKNSCNSRGSGGSACGATETICGFIIC